MGSTKEDDEEDHLEEGDVEVAGGEGQAEDAEDGGEAALEDGHAESVEAATNPFLASSGDLPSSDM